MKSIDAIELLKIKGYKFEIYNQIDIDYLCFSNYTDIKANSIVWIKDVNKLQCDLNSLDTNLLIVTNVNLTNVKNPKITFLVGENSKALFFELLNEFYLKKSDCFISNNATVETKSIGKNVSIGNNSYVNKDVIIGNNVTIKNNVVIECPTIIGNNCIIESGCIIGSSGFGYYNNSLGLYQKVPDFGGVIIGDGVEIGANTCIDRGTLGDTIIKDNVKIDNLCHIAHNVVIEKNCMIIALSLLGGSSHLEENVYVAPGSLVKNQLNIGRESLIGMGAVVVKDVENNKVMAGVPAKILRDNK